jgi:hypothetical protein
VAGKGACPHLTAPAPVHPARPAGLRCGFYERRTPGTKGLSGYSHICRMRAVAPSCRVLRGSVK